MPTEITRSPRTRLVCHGMEAIIAFRRLNQMAETGPIDRAAAYQVLDEVVERAAAIEALLSGQEKAA